MKYKAFGKLKVHNFQILVPKFQSVSKQLSDKSVEAEFKLKVSMLAQLKQSSSMISLGPGFYMNGKISNLRSNEPPTIK